MYPTLLVMLAYEGHMKFSTGPIVYYFSSRVYSEIGNYYQPARCAERVSDLPWNFLAPLGSESLPHIHI